MKNFGNRSAFVKVTGPSIAVPPLDSWQVPLLNEQHLRVANLSPPTN